MARTTDSYHELSPLRQRASRRVGWMMPVGLQNRVGGLLRYAGIREDPRVWLGHAFLLALLAGVTSVAIYLLIFNPITSAVTISIAAGLFFGGIGLVAMLSYLGLYYKTVNRTAKMENILPDFLLLTASNLRAGTSPFASFVSAARPEFGPFYEEVMLSTAKSGGRTPLQVALTEVSTYFDSQVLRRSVNLFAKGLRSGGHLAKLLTSIAQEVRRIQDLRDELTSSTRTYTIFLAFILVVVMPFLLSISSHFVAVFLSISAENALMGGSPAEDMPIFTGKLSISTDDMVMISLVSILSTSLFVSLLIGIVAKGKAAYGVKYFPLLAIASSFAYFVAKALIEGFLSGFAI